MNIRPCPRCGHPLLRTVRGWAHTAAGNRVCYRIPNPQPRKESRA